MDSYFQITIERGQIDDEGNKVNVINLIDTLTRLPDEQSAIEQSNELLNKVQ
jgi:hypothetical protein